MGPWVVSGVGRAPVLHDQLGQPLGAVLAGTVRDETGGALPGVVVEVAGATGVVSTVSDRMGGYQFNVEPGTYVLTFTLINFASSKRSVRVDHAPMILDAVLHLSLSADVTVTGTRTFTNLADVENPAENLVGIAQSASQGAITARQLDARPIMRAGEVLETVPGRGHHASTAARARPTSTTCAASTSITAPTSRRPSPACRSTCRRTGTARATPTSIS